MVIILVLRFNLPYYYNLPSGTSVTHTCSGLLHARDLESSRNAISRPHILVRMMAKISTENEISSKPPYAHKGRIVGVVTELLENLRQDKSTCQSELITMIETLKEIAKPTEGLAIDLFEAIEKKFPHRTLGKDKWYLVVVSKQELQWRPQLTPISFLPLLEFLLTMLAPSTSFSSTSPNIRHQHLGKLLSDTYGKPSSKMWRYKEFVNL